MTASGREINQTAAAAGAMCHKNGERALRGRERWRAQLPHASGGASERRRGGGSSRKREREVGKEKRKEVDRKT